MTSLGNTEHQYWPDSHSQHPESRLIKSYFITYQQ